MPLRPFRNIQKHSHWSKPSYQARMQRPQTNFMNIRARLVQSRGKWHLLVHKLQCHHVLAEIQIRNFDGDELKTSYSYGIILICLWLLSYFVLWCLLEMNIYLHNLHIYIYTQIYVYILWPKHCVNRHNILNYELCDGLLLTHVIRLT